MLLWGLHHNGTVKVMTHNVIQISVDLIVFLTKAVHFAVTFDFDYVVPFAMDTKHLKATKA